MTTDEIIGTFGVTLLLAAYFLNIFSILPKNGKAFFIMNIAGAGIACLASYLIHYWPFVILEGMWTLVSIAGLIKISN